MVDNGFYCFFFLGIESLLYFKENEIGLEDYIKAFEIKTLF